MKKLLCLLSIPLSWTAHAQITLTYSDLPSAGDTYKFYIHKDNAQTIHSGPSGANRTWNFSSLRRDDSTIQSYTTPAGHVGASKLPAANLYSDTGKIFFRKATDGLYLDGFTYQNDTNVVDLQPDVLGIAVPSSYLSSSNGAGNAVLTIKNPDPLSSIDSYRNVYHEQIAVTYDGYGTLVLPNATYPVLRGLSRVIISDTVYGHSSAGYTMLTSIKDTVYSYAWIARGYGGGVLTMDSSRANGIGAIRFLKAKISTGVGAMPEATATADRVFPNPAAGSVHFSLHASGAIHIFDAKGTVVRTLQTTDGEGDFDVRDLPNGTYFYLAADARAPKAGSFLVAH